MNCANSHYFFHNVSGLVVENNWESRLLCLKDFLKRCALFPLALLLKGWKTLMKGVGVGCATLLLLLTLGNSSLAREFFLERVTSLAKEIADWILLPFALLSCFFRLILALAIHPNLYFNAFD
jgi:hypothetical protein